jgi:hypothetical protein
MTNCFRVRTADCSLMIREGIVIDSRAIEQGSSYSTATAGDVPFVAATSGSPLRWISLKSSAATSLLLKRMLQSSFLGKASNGIAPYQTVSSSITFGFDGIVDVHLGKNRFYVIARSRGN